MFLEPIRSRLPSKQLWPWTFIYRITSVQWMYLNQQQQFLFCSHFVCNKDGLISSIRRVYLTSVDLGSQITSALSPELPPTSIFYHPSPHWLHLSSLAFRPSVFTALLYLCCGRRRTSLTLAHLLTDTTGWHTLTNTCGAAITHPVTAHVNRNRDARWTRVSADCTCPSESQSWTDSWRCQKPRRLQRLRNPATD